MIATRHYIESIDFTHPCAGKRRLADFSVNIYSDVADTVREGDIITVCGELRGYDRARVALQWQVCDDSLDWRDVQGATGLSHAFIATPESINYSWRLSIKEKE